MKIYFHIGQTKTASTTIQSGLANIKNKKKIEHLGIHYPNNKFAYSFRQDHIYSFMPLVIEDMVKIDGLDEYLANNNMTINEYKGKLREFWRNEIIYMKDKGLESMVISLETISSASLNHGKIIENAVDFLESLVDEVVIVLYVREFNSWAISQLKQDIKYGIIDNLDNSTEKMVRKYLPSLQVWIDCCNKSDKTSLVVRKFERKLFVKEDIFIDFLSVINENAEQFIYENDSQNTALDSNSTKFLLEFNKKYPLLLKDNVLNKERGLHTTWIPEYLYPKEGERFKYNLKLNDVQTDTIKTIYKNLNKYIKDGEMTFSGYNDCEETTDMSIPIDFFVELINNYNKRIQKLENQVNELKK